MQPPPSHRFAHLDALRGVASLSVVFSHYITFFVGLQRPDLESIQQFFRAAAKSPALLFFSASPPVLLFFVLSGFVLTFMLTRQKASFGAYAIRRICRIWLPYFASLMFALTCIALIGWSPSSEYSEWFNKLNGHDIELMQLLKHIFLVGYFETDAYNFVVWTLVYEMRISLVFPLIYWCLCRTTLKRAVVSSLIAGMGSCVLAFLFKRYGSEAGMDYALTAHYAVFFVVGSLMAMHLKAVVDWYERLSKVQRVILTLFVLCSCLLPQMVPKDVIPYVLRHYLMLPGVAGIMLFALCAEAFKRLLQHRILLFFGHISYSIYLLHGIVLLSIVGLFYRQLPLPVFLSIGFAVTILLSWLCYR
ncbi:MAG TPA: acyltransferase, partial [Burkholderiales bacterium]|nr:acyltransferase [Burkholderiales bacterium]